MGLTNHLPSDAILECLVALTDREAGRDAPLTADEEASIRHLVRMRTPASRLSTMSCCAINAALNTLFQAEPEAGSSA